MKRNGDVKLAAIPPQATSILELTKVNHLFEIFDNVSDAVDSFHQTPVSAFQPAMESEYASPEYSGSDYSTPAFGTAA